MLPENEEAFNRGVALILARLYEAFPNKIDLAMPQLDSEAGNKTLAIYANTVEFLFREGFLHYPTSVYSGAEQRFHQVMLTKKGLDVLGKTPEALKEKKPLGDTLRQLAKEGSKEAIKLVVKQVFAAGMEYLRTPSV